MEKKTPVRKPHTSTADLLTWSENPPADSLSGSAPRSSARSHMPSDGISKVVFGGQVTDEEVESLNKRKPVSGYKLKEITGSGIFAAGGENGEEDTDAANGTPSNPTGVRMYQQAVAGISHISFGEEETVSPKKSISEAKQRELSGTLDSESEARLKKQISDAKNKELSGHDIFAPPPEIQPRPLAARALALRESITIGETAPDTEESVIKTAKKIPNQKLTELSGNNIFKGDEAVPCAEKPLSSAKLREMSGSNIFADGKAESRDYLGGVRKPPGGESSIALV
ncbi:putative DNA oxidative demethylase [Helianthus annuus]|nr:putative DNA oxidative demethylase [Helianthus annuus]